MSITTTPLGKKILFAGTVVIVLVAACILYNILKPVDWKKIPDAGRFDTKNYLPYSSKRQLKRVFLSDYKEKKKNYDILLKCEYAETRSKEFERKIREYEVYLKQAENARFRCNKDHRRGVACPECDRGVITAQSLLTGK